MISKLLPEIWKNKKQILEGIKNRTFKQDHIENIKEYRQEKCKKCIWYTPNIGNTSYQDAQDIIKKQVNQDWFDTVKEMGGARCMHCSCNVGEDSIKLRCLSCACPIGSWPAISTEEEEELIKSIILINKNEEENKK